MKLRLLAIYLLFGSVIILTGLFMLHAILAKVAELLNRLFGQRNEEEDDG